MERRKNYQNQTVAPFVLFANIGFRITNSLNHLSVDTMEESWKEIGYYDIRPNRAR